MGGEREKPREKEVREVVRVGVRKVRAGRGGWWRKEQGWGEGKSRRGA